MCRLLKKVCIAGPKIEQVFKTTIFTVSGGAERRIFHSHTHFLQQHGTPQNAPFLILRPWLIGMTTLFLPWMEMSINKNQVKMWCNLKAE